MIPWYLVHKEDVDAVNTALLSFKDVDVTFTTVGQPYWFTVIPWCLVHKDVDAISKVQLSFMDVDVTFTPVGQP